MGVYSWNCKKCNHSVKAVTVEGWEYMNEAVLLLPNGSIIIGEYNGYGCVGDYAIDDPFDAELWHKVCWENTGKPSYSGPSSHADDQGYFYNDPTPQEIREAIALTK